MSDQNDSADRTPRIRSKTVTRESMLADKARLNLARGRPYSRRIYLEARIRRDTAELREVEAKEHALSENVAGINGLLSLMEEAGAVAYIEHDGVVAEWVMADGSKKSTSKPVSA